MCPCLFPGVEKTRYVVSTTLFTNARSLGEILQVSGARLSRGAFHPKEPDLRRLGAELLGVVR